MSSTADTAPCSPRARAHTHRHTRARAHTHTPLASGSALACAALQHWRVMTERSAVVAGAWRGTARDRSRARELRRAGGGACIAAGGVPQGARDAGRAAQARDDRRPVAAGPAARSAVFRPPARRRAARMSAWLAVGRWAQDRRDWVPKVGAGRRAAGSHEKDAAAHGGRGASQPRPSRLQRPHPRQVVPRPPACAHAVDPFVGGHA